MPLPIFLPSCSTPPLLYIAGMDSLLSGSLHEILVLIIGGVPRVCRGGGGVCPGHTTSSPPLQVSMDSLLSGSLHAYIMY